MKQQVKNKDWEYILKKWKYYQEIHSKNYRATGSVPLRRGLSLGEAWAQHRSDVGLVSVRRGLTTRKVWA